MYEGQVLSQDLVYNVGFISCFCVLQPSLRGLTNPAAPPVLTRYFCYILYTSFPGFETSFQFGHNCSTQEEQPGPETGPSVDEVVTLMVVLPCDDANFSIFVRNESLGEPESRSKVP